MEKCHQRGGTTIQIRTQTKCSRHIFDEYEDGHEGFSTFSHEIESIAFGRWYVTRLHSMFEIRSNELFSLIFESIFDFFQIKHTLL